MEGGAPQPEPPPLAPEEDEPDGTRSLWGQRGCVPPARGPSRTRDRGQFRGKSRKDGTPTPEQASFSLCAGADLPALSTLFIQTEAAGWLSHRCVCRYIDFVLKEDRLNPAWAASLWCPSVSIVSWESCVLLPSVTAQRGAGPRGVAWLVQEDTVSKGLGFEPRTQVLVFQRPSPW